MAVDHYENFPVASILLPARLRPAVEAIYRFARSADDLADEGDATPEQRLAALGEFECALQGIQRGIPSESPLFIDLAEIISIHSLPIQACQDLLSAFKQDVVTKRYRSFDDVLDYCRRSANPVGTLMLHLHGAATPANLRDSDRICSALQLINFWQDIAIDWQMGRIYLPLDDLECYGVSEAQIAEGRVDAAFGSMMRFEIERVRAMMLAGAPLALRLPGRIGWELRLVVQGGLRILEKIEKAGCDVFVRRPALRKTDWLAMFWRAIWMQPS